MARVFRGKVAIPGDQMEAYFQALEQFEQGKKPLRKQLEQCAHDFVHTLARQYTPKTVRKHEQILALFIDFVCWDTDVRRIEDITRGIANSHFRQWYQRKVGDRTESELKTTMKRFFHFLAEEKEIRNEAVLKSSQR
jgi:site-specific recombinase XerD